MVVYIRRINYYNTFKGQLHPGHKHTYTYAPNHTLIYNAMTLEPEARWRQDGPRWRRTLLQWHSATLGACMACVFFSSTSCWASNIYSRHDLLKIGVHCSRVSTLTQDPNGRSEKPQLSMDYHPRGEEAKGSTVRESRSEAAGPAR